MSTKTGSLKKVAVLAGMTMLVGGAEISTASADMVSAGTLNFDLLSNGSATVSDTSQSLSAFDPLLGDLTNVQYIVDETFSDSGSSSASSATSTVNIDSVNLNSLTVHAFPAHIIVTVTAPVSSVGSGLADASLYTGGSIPVGFYLDVACLEAPLCNTEWKGSLSLTYTYTPAVVPLPGALPMFATGLGALGLLGWRRKRKQVAA